MSAGGVLGRAAAPTEPDGSLRWWRAAQSAANAISGASSACDRRGGESFEIVGIVLILASVERRARGSAPAGAPPWPSLAQLPPAGTGGWAGSTYWPGFESNPDCGSARYGNWSRKRDVGLIDAVPERHLVADQEPGDHLEVDVDDVVDRAGGRSGSRPVSPPMTPKRLGARRRRHAEVELQRVHRGAGELAGVLVQPRDALEHRLDDVRAVGLRRVDVEQRVQHRRQLRVGRVLAVQLGVAVRESCG